MVKTANFKCSQCIYTSSKKYNLQRHVKLKHPLDSEEQIEKYKCISCDYETKWKFDLKSHLLHRHTDGSRIAWFECRKCKFKAKTKTALKRHDLHRHANLAAIKWFCCPACRYKSKTAVNLKRHVNCMHNVDCDNENKQLKNRKKGHRKNNNMVKEADEIQKREQALTGIKCDETKNVITQDSGAESLDGGELDRKKFVKFDLKQVDNDYKMSADGFVYLKNLC